MRLTKRSMDEMIANFNREVSCMDLSVADKIKILGMITAIGFRYKEDVQFVHAIPTAQPEPCEDDPRADVYYLAEKIGIHQLYALVVQLRGEPEPCEDAVSRQEVADILENADPDLYVDLFNKLPSVTPKQRTGKWIHVSEETWKCDQCGEISCCSPNFCPDCGSRNEVTT